MSENKHTREQLKELQGLPLWRKVQITQARLIEFYQHFDGKVAISFSGGKDSTVLLHIARQLFPEIKAVFSNTGLEYPEIQQFVREQENVDIIRPAMAFSDVITNYGYPIISKETARSIHYARMKNKSKSSVTSRMKLLSKYTGSYQESYQLAMTQKEHGGDLPLTNSQFNCGKWLPICQQAPFRISHYCCSVMKKSPIHKYQTAMKLAPIVATMAAEGRERKLSWLKNGCNNYGVRTVSQPMSFWTEQDVLEYIHDYGLKIAPVYGDVIVQDNQGQIAVDPTMPGCEYITTGAYRTGCIFCGFGFHLDGRHGMETRFQRLKHTHPRQYEYCMDGGQWIDNPDYDPDYDGTPDAMGWVEWNPPKLWVPSKDGLGMRYVFDKCNEIMGYEIYKYE